MGAPGGTPWRIGGEQRCERDRRGRRACPIEPSAVSGRSREQKDRSKSRKWEHQQGRGRGGLVTLRDSKAMRRVRMEATCASGGSCSGALGQTQLSPNNQDSAGWGKWKVKEEKGEMFLKNNNNNRNRSHRRWLPCVRTTKDILESAPRLPGQWMHPHRRKSVALMKIWNLELLRMSAR